MTFETLEILALILIVATAIKLVIFIINPKWWYGFIEGVYSKPPLTSLIAFVLAMIVLYLLLVSGITIIEILAVCLFVALLIAVGLSKYADKLIPWVKGQDIVFVLKEMWLYTLVWLLLLVWGVGEILLS
jgi:hypothetical protein